MNKEILMTHARTILKNAYCPYSHFPVGAALLFEDGRVISGANVENVSFSATSCAERSALFYAISQGYRKGSIKAIAVAGHTEDFLPPCNVCRQALVEFCSPETPVYLTRKNGDILELTLNDLTPYSFTNLDM